ncbi:hypothetical protein PGIGA_G00245540 [Pangasianodon gigas]|uniref:Uncharacterized protein n=1 Tax=Pangasianodon gigas TaxID=30993 RepID=A0ACC5WPI3_PANGG|nr:hypothetical protein [Pangasianodon gigas]
MAKPKRKTKYSFQEVLEECPRRESDKSGDEVSGVNVMNHIVTLWQRQCLYREEALLSTSNYLM